MNSENRSRDVRARGGRRRRRVLFVVGGALLLVVPAFVGLKAWIEARMETFLKTDLLQMGIQVEYEEADLSVLQRRIVLSEVMVFEVVDEMHPVAQVEEISFAVTLRELRSQHAAWGAAELRNASLFLRELSEPDIRGLDAEVKLGRNRVELVKATGVSLGATMRLAGEVEWIGRAEEPEKLEEETEEPGDETVAKPRRRMPELPAEFNFLFDRREGGELCELDVWFSWKESRGLDENGPDRSKADPLQLRIMLRGRNFHWREHLLNRANVAFDYREGRITLSPFEIETYGGDLKVAGLYDTRSRKLEIESIHSTVDLPRLIGELFDGTREKARFWKPLSPLVLDARGLILDFADPWASKGAVTVQSEGGVIYTGLDAPLPIERFAVAVAVQEPRKLEVRQLEGLIGGFAANLRGTMLFPERAGKNETSRQIPGGKEATGTPKRIVETDSEEDPSRPDRQFLGRFVKLLSCESKEEPPALTVEFHLDLAELARTAGDEAVKKDPLRGLNLSGSLRGRNFEWLGVSYNTLNAEVKAVDGELQVPLLLAEGPRGEVRFKGSYNFQSDHLAVEELKTRVDPLSAAERLGITRPEALKRWTFVAPPSLQGKDLLIDFAQPENSVFRVEIESTEGLVFTGEERQVPLAGLRATVIHESPFTLRLEETEGRFAGVDVSLTCDLKLPRRSTEAEPGAEAEAEAEAEIEPSTEQAAAPPRARQVKATKNEDGLTMMEKLLKAFAIEPKADPPRLVVAARYDAGSDAAGFDLKNLEAEGSFEGSNFAWYGRDYSSLGLEAKFKDGIIDFPSVSLNAGDGRLELAGSYVLDSKLLTFRQFQTSIDIIPFLENWGIGTKGWASRLNVLSPPILSGRNLQFDLGNPRNSRAAVLLRSSEGLEWTLANGNPVRFRDIRGDLRLADGMVTVSGLSAQILGGLVALDATVSILADPVVYTLDFGLRKASFKQLTEAAGLRERIDGTLDVSFYGRGEKSITSIEGGGTAELKTEQLRSATLLGGMFDVVGSVFPFFQSSRIEGLTLSYGVADGVLRSSDITFLTNRIRIVADGEIDFVKNRIEITARAHSRTILDVVTSVFSRLLTVKGEGNFENVEWRLKHFTRPEREESR